MGSVTLLYNPALGKIEDVLLSNVAAKQNLILELVQNHRVNGAPSINDFNIKAVAYSAAYPLKGTIDVEYLVDVTFGCEDLSNQYRGNDNLTFEIDEAAGTLQITIPEYPTRDTLDEF